MKALNLMVAGVLGVGGLIAAGPVASAQDTATPIKHVVVIFGENISFDHYFGTYPKAANVDGETLQGSGAPAAHFEADPATPTDIATLSHDGADGDKNPNAYKPFRFTPQQAVTCDQNHEYKAEQEAYNGGAMDRYVEATSKDKCASAGATMYEAPGETMGYYDGNTVTGLWNYAQHYAMNDHSFSSVFGPSTPGALNLISGQTHGITSHDPNTGAQTAQPDSSFVESPAANGTGTDIEDPDPLYDDCSNGNDRSAKSNLASMDGKNVGDLLNAKGITWGWFQGGFRPSKPWDGTDGHYAVCKTGHKTVAGGAQDDYNPHHQPFMYYGSTSNPHHLPPANAAEIGHDGPANHQYDLADFDVALANNSLPAVSYLKAGKYQDGHAATSDPIDEQNFITHQLNQLQQSDSWRDTAVVLMYDDSDGWYDHLPATLLNGSSDPKQDTPLCADFASRTAPLGGYQNRCGPGPRQPFLVVSPYAKRNFVDHTVTEQTSVLKFIEDNWSLGRIGDSSFDERAGTMNALFDFGAPPRTDTLFLNETNGQIAPNAAAVTGAPQAAVVNPSNTAASGEGSGGLWWKVGVPVAVVVVLVAFGGYALLRSRRA